MNLKDIEDALRKVGLKDLSPDIARAIDKDFDTLIKGYKPITIDKERTKLRCPNGIKIIFNSDAHINEKLS